MSIPFVHICDFNITIEWLYVTTRTLLVFISSKHEWDINIRIHLLIAFTMVRYIDIKIMDKLNKFSNTCRWRQNGNMVIPLPFRVFYFFDNLTSDKTTSNYMLKKKCVSRIRLKDVKSDTHTHTKFKCWNTGSSRLKP